MNQVNFKEIERKEALLQNLKIHLKEKFIGLDDIIDEVISNIHTWFVFPQVINRPVIINLWGITGVGKTDLVRTIVKFMEYQDKYVELQMNGDGAVNTDANGYGMDSFKEALLAADMETDTPGIMLIDEVQKFRTLDEQGDSLEDSSNKERKFNDMWMLLSDGKFPKDLSTKEEAEEAFLRHLYNKDSQDVKSANQFDDDDEDDEAGNREYKRSHWKAKELKKVFRLKNKVVDLMRIDGLDLIDLVRKRLADPDLYSDLDFTKLLIFISGNLDEAFRSAINVHDVEQDADVIHEQTKKINIVDIKQALTRRFLPEQIARFGNSHVIYPSLSRKSYEAIIDKHLAILQTELKSDVDITINFDQSYKTLIYDNGVYPAQGIRPVLSTVDTLYSSLISQQLISALKKGVKELNVTFADRKCTLKDTKGNIVSEKDYNGQLDDIRDKKLMMVDSLYCTAVHEAGHVAVYASLYGTVPIGASITLTSTTSEGVTNLHRTDGSYPSLIKKIAVAYGGLVAEEFFFGKDNGSVGCSGDVAMATDIAGTLIKEGLQSKDVLGLVSDAPAAGHVIRPESKEASLMQGMLRSQYEAAVDVVSEHKALIIELTEAMVENIKLTQKDIYEITKKHIGGITMLPTDEVLGPNYKDMFEMKKDPF